MEMDEGIVLTEYRKRCLKRKAGIMYRVVYGMLFMFFAVYTYSAVKKWRGKIKRCTKNQKVSGKNQKV